MLDHLIEGEDAASDLTAVLATIRSETEVFTAKIAKHTDNIDRLAKTSSSSTPRDVKKVVLLAASDMNTFSRRVNKVLPDFAKSTRYWIEVILLMWSMRTVPSLIVPESTLRDSLIQMLLNVAPAKEGVATFRDSTRSIRKQNISRDLNNAADLQWKALDNVLIEIERVESFALRISFLIEERFGLS